MHAILLSGGCGTRLRPLTVSTPKCLVPIKGVPLIDVWLANLRDVGVGRILINTHYLAKAVEGHFESSQYREMVSLTFEEVLLGTAGTLYQNIHFYKEMDGYLIHADNYCLANLSEFYAAHLARPSCCLITMMTFRATNPSECGVVEIDERGIVIGFHEKVEYPPTNLANGAIYLLSKEFLSSYKVNFRDAKDFSNDVLPKLMGKIYSYETNDSLLDIGTMERYEQANN